MTEREFQAYKEKAIAQDVLSVENRIRHAFNQGVECGRKLQTQPQDCVDPTHKHIENTLDCVGDRAISLEAVHDLIATWLDDYLSEETREALETIDGKIDDMPPVTPQPKMGHWIEEDMFDGDVAYRCSECNELFWIEYGTPKDNGYNFCPKCGKRLVEAQKSEDV